MLTFIFHDIFHTPVHWLNFPQGLQHEETVVLTRRLALLELLDKILRAKHLKHAKKMRTMKNNTCLSTGSALFLSHVVCRVLRWRDDARSNPLARSSHAAWTAACQILYLTQKLDKNTALSSRNLPSNSITIYFAPRFDPRQKTSDRNWIRWM